MTHDELISKSVYDQCIEAGCDVLHARDAAQMAVKKYKDGNYQSPAKLIKDSVISAGRIKQRGVSKSWK